MLQPLHIDQDRQLQLLINDLVGESVAVLGIKGSGKTNTAAVLIEELLANALPLTIVDIEGEYWGLRERFEILVAGRSSQVDIEASPDQAPQLAEFSIKQSIPIILDVSEFDQEEMNDFLLAYFKRLWEVNFIARKPYEIILEEAHEFVPQTVRSPLKQILTRIALRGRKRGLGLISISQRSAKVEKDILTQAGIVFLHQVIHPTDIKVYQDIIPKPAREVEEMIAQLHKGQAILLAHNQVLVTQIRQRHTFHAGATPELSQAGLPELRKIDQVTLKALSDLLAHPPMAVTGINEVTELRSRNLELECLVASKDAEIQRLKSGRSVDSSHTAVTPNNSSPQNKSVSESASTPEFYRSTTAVTRDQNRQERQFELLISDLRKLRKDQQAVLRFLAEREGKEVSEVDLAHWLDLSQSTIRNNLPGVLGRIGLITRVKANGKTKYSSPIRTVFQHEYASLNTDALIKKLIDALPSRDR